MEDFLPLYYYVINALFFGFGFVTVCLLLPSTFYSAELQRIVSTVIESAAKLMRVVAIVYFIIAIAALYKQASAEENFLTMENFFGDGAAFFWIKIVMVPLLLQLFWFSKTYRNKWIVFFIALITGFFFLILNERFIIMTTTIHRDYLPDGWASHFYSMLGYYLKYLGEQLLIFIGFLGAYHLIRNSLKKN